MKAYGYNNTLSALDETLDITVGMTMEDIDAVEFMNITDYNFHFKEYMADYEVFSTDPSGGWAQINE